MTVSERSERTEENERSEFDVFKKYDIRGSLTDDFVRELGKCFAGKYGSVVVVSDPKESSKRYSRIFSESVNMAGFDVIDCGVGPTDMCSVAGLHFGLPSVMFTASHLSDEQDGIKFHDISGLPFSSEMIDELKGLKPVTGASVGVVKVVDFTGEYSNRVIARYRELFNHDLMGLKVLVDLKNGCGISPSLLRRLGAVVTVVNTEGSDPCNGGLAELTKRAVDYDLVLAHDFDADRIVVVDSDGVVHGSLIACMLTKVFTSKVVASIDTSHVLSSFAPVISSKVGDPFVARAIIDNDACLGVEPSGHYTDPLFASTSSGSLFALLIAGLVSKRSVKEYLAELPSINIESTEVKVNDKDSFMTRIRGKVGSLISDVDGLKFSFNGGTALVRPSGTEPIIRFHLENPSRVGEVQDLVRSLL